MTFGSGELAATAPAHVLVVDDEPALRRSVARFLLAKGFAVDTAEDGPAALDLLKTRSIDVLLLDSAMPSMSGLDVLARAKALYPDLEVVMMTPFGDLDASLAAVRAGAYGFISKPIANPDDVSLALERAAERRRLHDRARALERRLEQHERLGELVGNSAAMQDVYRVALGVAPTSSPVLIVGERGTGKELLARAVHRHSTRADRPFRAIDCAAVPAAVADLELFGGTPEQPGLFELANQGTVFLDDIGELPLPVQAKLVRVLAKGEVERAFAAVPVHVDVRLIASSGADLSAAVAKGTFREDLYYRLGAIRVQLPPLRRRRDDVPLLAYHFLEKYARRSGRDLRRISVEALRLLRDHPWPGNVRELESAIEHAVVMARGDAITPADLSFSRARAPDDGEAETVLLDGALTDLAYPEAKDRAVEAFDRAYVERLMKRAGGIVSEAARQAGLDRSNFRRLLKKVRRKAATR